MEKHIIHKQVYNPANHVRNKEIKIILTNFVAEQRHSGRTGKQEAEETSRDPIEWQVKITNQHLTEQMERLFTMYNKPYILVL